MIIQGTNAWPKGIANSVVEVGCGSFLEIGEGGQVGDICHSVNNNKKNSIKTGNLVPALHNLFLWFL